MKIISQNKKFKILKLYYEGMPAATICRDYHIPHSILYKWITDYPWQSFLNIKAKEKPISLPKLLSHSRKLEGELAFLKRTVIKDIPLRERMAIIDEEYGKESIHLQCDALDVNRSSYLNHRYHNKNDDAWFKRRKAEYTSLVADIFEESGRVYGARKIAAAMKRRGKPVSEDYVRRIMIENGLISIRNASDKTYRIMARRSREEARSSQELKVDGINQVWVSDTTAIHIHNRYYYICVYVDAFSRKAVGCNIGRNNSTQLTKRTFLKAFHDRKPKSLIIHTDNGQCYTSYSYNQALMQCGVDHSYSRIREPRDNPIIESFFGSLKREELLPNSIKSFRELKVRVDKFVEKYNSERLHGSLNYLPPDEFEAQFLAKTR